MRVRRSQKRKAERTTTAAALVKRIGLQADCDIDFSSLGDEAFSAHTLGDAMQVTRRGLLQTAAAALPVGRAARAQGTRDKVIRIGVLSDMSGPYRDVTGPTSVACARQAVEDFGSVSV